MHAMAPDISHFEHHLAGEFALDAEIPANGIGISDLWVKNSQLLSEEGAGPGGQAHRSKYPVGERIRKRGRGRQVVVAGRAELGGLAEALLVNPRAVSSAGPVHHRLDGSHKYSEAGADDGLVAQARGRPRETGARAEDVGVGAVLVGVGRIGKGEAAERAELAGGNQRIGILGVGRGGGSGGRIYRGGVKAVDQAIVAFADRNLMLPTESEIEGEIVAHSPVVLDKEGHVLGVRRTMGVKIDLSAGWQPQQ